jgi:transcription initiation factor IIE alpha subunit
MPRKTVSIVSCAYEGCRDFAEVKDLNETSEGWLQVQVAIPDSKYGFVYDRQFTFEFSSPRCLERWAKARREVTGEYSRTRRNDRNKYDEILSAIKELGEDFTSKDLQTLLGITQGTVDRNLRIMRDNGVITTLEETPGNKPNRYTLVSE